MKITVLVNNIACNNPLVTEHEIEISEDMTLQDLLDSLDCSMADVSNYFEISGVFAWNSSYCPYILTKQGIQYNLPYDKVKVFDFINTHEIRNNTLRVTTGYPQAGGPGFIEAKEIWDAVQPHLNNIAIFCTIFGVSISGIITSIRSHFEKKEIPPHTVLDILASRKQWNHKELAYLLGFPEENTKNLLKAFGYIYDSGLMQYVPSENTEKLREQISSVQVHDI